MSQDGIIGNNKMVSVLLRDPGNLYNQLTKWIQTLSVTLLPNLQTNLETLNQNNLFASYFLKYHILIYTKYIKYVFYLN